MALVRKSVLVGYSAQRMYGLVDDVERYPEFLPWCGGTEVEHRDGQITRASIRIDYHGIHQSFKTENRTQPPELIEIRLVSGPFRALDGTLAIHLARRGCLPHRLRAALRVLQQAAGEAGRTGIPATSPTASSTPFSSGPTALREMSGRFGWKWSMRCRCQQDVVSLERGCGCDCSPGSGSKRDTGSPPGHRSQRRPPGDMGPACNAGCALARGRPGGDLSPATGGSQGGAAAPRGPQAPRLDRSRNARTLRCTSRTGPGVAGGPRYLHQESATLRASPSSLAISSSDK